MNTGARLALFGVSLVAVVGVGALVGNAVGPIDTGASGQTSATQQPDTQQPDTQQTDNESAGQLGYTLAATQTQIGDEPFSFTITDPDGEPVADYDVLHEKQLHLIVVSTGLRTYAHLHPELAEDGQWSVALPDLAPGDYRAIADFSPAGAGQMNLGIDLVIPGEATAEAQLDQTLVDDVDDLEVTLEALGSAWSEVRITVRRGTEVLTTEPYLGVAGHLVAIAADDLTYLHTHAMDAAPAGPVRFAVELPSGATHALFFDFKVDGEVRTAHFVIEREGTDGDNTEHGH